MAKMQHRASNEPGLTGAWLPDVYGFRRESIDRRQLFWIDTKCDRPVGCPARRPLVHCACKESDGHGKARRDERRRHEAAADAGRERPPVDFHDPFSRFDFEPTDGGDF